MKYFFFIAVTFLTIQCKTRPFDTNPPFEITSATSTKWFGGQPGVSGVNVFIEYSVNKDIQFDSLYFSNKVVKIKYITTNNKQLLAGYFSTSTRNQKSDLTFHRNPINEKNNKVLQIQKFPFILKENEAVLSYIEGSNTKYFKITGIKKGKTPMYQ